MQDCKRKKRGIDHGGDLLIEVMEASYLQISTREVKPSDHNARDRNAGEGVVSPRVGNIRVHTVQRQVWSSDCSSHKPTLHKDVDFWAALHAAAGYDGCLSMPMLQVANVHSH